MTSTTSAQSPMSSAGSYRRGVGDRGRWKAGELLRYLREHRGFGIHIIDPFKVELEQAIDKAQALQGLGVPWLILASTDCPDFETRMKDYVPAVRDAVEIPVVLHFPPTPGRGFPVVAGADGYLLPALMLSSSPYFVWHSYLETMLTWPEVLPPTQWPELVHAAAITIGRDERTQRLLGTQPLDESPDGVAALGREITRYGHDLVYLYSRHERVPPETCRQLRALLPPEQLIFVSGNVCDADRIRQYLDAGADFVGFAGALECPDWPGRMHQMLSGPNQRSAGRPR